MPGYTIGEPGARGRILGRALATSEPVVVRAVVGPVVPPLPAKGTFEQAKQLAEALTPGEPSRGKIARTVFAEKVRGMSE